MTSLPGPQAWGSPTSQNTSSRTHCPCGFSDTHHCPQGWRLGQSSPLALSARTHSAKARIQLPEHHHGAFSTLCLSPAFLHQPPNCLPSTHSPARGDTNGVLPNSKPFRDSQGLEDKTPSSLSRPVRLPWPCPNLRLARLPVRKLQLWPPGLPRGLCTHWRPHRCRGLVRLVLSGSSLPPHKHTSLPSLWCRPHGVQTAARAQQGCPSEAESASGRQAAPCCASHGSHLPRRTQDSSCRGPTAGAQTLGPSYVSTPSSVSLVPKRSDSPWGHAQSSWAQMITGQILVPTKNHGQLQASDKRVVVNSGLALPGAALSGTARERVVLALQKIRA